jgi:adenosine deaminase
VTQSLGGDRQRTLPATHRNLDGWGRAFRPLPPAGRKGVGTIQSPERDLRALPKANLHLHLTGSMRPATLAELAARHRIPVPPPLASGGVHEWAAFQGRYDAARDAVRSQADIRRIVTEAIEDNLADGCGWVEIQVDPTSYAPRLGGVEPVLAAVLEATAGAPAGVIVSSSWARSGAHAATLAALAARYAGQGVVGFGLSNDERLGAVPEFAPAFRTATRPACSPPRTPASTRPPGTSGPACGPSAPPASATA